MSESLFRVESFQNVMVLHLSRDTANLRYQEKQQEYNQRYRVIEQTPNPLVVFSFDECEMLDSVTVGILVQLTKCARSNGGDAVLSGVNDSLAETLRTLMLLERDGQRAVWTQYSDVSTAVKALTRVPGSVC